jgi:mannitol-1-phosphate/altronate dehydrogenase
MLVEKMMDYEVTLIVPQVPAFDLTEYKKTLIERLANPGNSRLAFAHRNLWLIGHS